MIDASDRWRINCKRSSSIVLYNMPTHMCVRVPNMMYYIQRGNTTGSLVFVSLRSHLSQFNNRIVLHGAPLTAGKCRRWSMPAFAHTMSSHKAQQKPRGPIAIALRNIARMCVRVYVESLNKRAHICPKSKCNANSTLTTNNYSGATVCLCVRQIMQM